MKKQNQFAQLWQNFFLCCAFEPRKLNLTVHWPTQLIQAGGHYTVPNFYSCRPIVCACVCVCVSACAHAFVCFSAQTCVCMVVSVLIWLEMLEWLTRGNWVNTELWLASLANCSDQGQALWSPIPRQATWPLGLFAQWIRAQHAMSPGCHSNSVVSLSSNEWNNRSISCITNRGFSWEDLLSFHVLAFGQFFLLRLFSLTATHFVCLSISHILILPLLFSLIVWDFFKSISTISPPLAVLTDHGDCKCHTVL